MNGATAVIRSASSVGTERDNYAHLIPLQRRYAELASGDVQRQRLHEQLISGYLPVAEHIARRIPFGQQLFDVPIRQRVMPPQTSGSPRCPQA